MKSVYVLMQHSVTTGERDGGYYAVVRADRNIYTTKRAAEKMADHLNARVPQARDMSGTLGPAVFVREQEPLDVAGVEAFIAHEAEQKRQRAEARAARLEEQAAKIRSVL